MNLLPVCIKCESGNSNVWWKCCPEHTSEQGPDVVCEACALELHPGFIPTPDEEYLVPPSTPNDRIGDLHMKYAKKESRSKAPVFIIGGVAAFVALLYFIIHVLRSDND